MPKSLLVADDSVVIQKLVGLSFANEEVELITTDNGDDAIKLVRERKPNLVLADVVMPGKSGYEVCQAIKQDPELAHIPVLLLTGTFEAFDEAKAKEVAADGHITKPFEAQILVERVNELLNRVVEDASPSAEAPVQVREGDYDFFDENTGDLAGAATAKPDVVDANLQFSAPLDAAHIPTPDSGTMPAEDRTIILAPGDDLLAAESIDPLMAPTGEPIADTSPELEGESDPGLTILDDFDFNTAEPAAAQSDPGETVLADDFSFEPAGTDAPAAMLGDDLFGDAPVTASPVPTSETFDFGSSGPLEASGEAVAHEDVAATPVPQAAASFVGDPLDSSVAADSDVTSVPITTPSLESPELEDLLEIEPLGDAPSDLRVELEADVDDASPLVSLDSPAEAAVELSAESGLDPTFESSLEPAFDSDIDSGIESPPEPAAEASHAPAFEPSSALPDLTPMIRERLHETLEKVAWEAFADISDSIVRQVVERVESIAWDVIPQMAESMIQEEIRRMKGESE